MKQAPEQTQALSAFVSETFQVDYLRGDIITYHCGKED
jgi:hypothetical protein